MTLTLTLFPKRERGGFHTDRFRAYTEAGDHIVTSRQPLFDAARELLRLGHDPATLLTVRHDGANPSFAPKPIGELAKWTVTERDKGGLRLERFRPWPSEHAREGTGKGARTGEDPQGPSSVRA